MQLNANYRNLLKSSEVFQGLDDQQIDLILCAAQKIDVVKDAYIIKEGEQKKEIYLLLSGKAEILKKENLSEELQISVLNPGQITGEAAAIDGLPRSTSVRTLEDCQFLVFCLSQFTSPEQRAIFKKITQNIAIILARNLRKTTEITVKALRSELEHSQARLELGNLLFSSLVILVAWIFFVSLINKHVSSVKVSSFISFPTILFMTLILIRHLKKSQFPLEFYGFTLKNWKKNALEGVAFSLPFLIGATFLKEEIVKYVLYFQGEDIFAVHLKSLGSWSFLIGPVYMLLAIPQEFIVRGTFQSTIQFTLSGSYKPLKAILLANFLFASFHSLFGLLFAVVAFTVGLFWGWLFHRQKSIVGCSVSHALIGGYSLWVLNFTDILRHYTV